MFNNIPQEHHHMDPSNRTLDWHNEPVPINVFNCVKMYVNTNRDYSTLTPSTMLTFCNHLRECLGMSSLDIISSDCVDGVSFERLISLYYVCTKAKIIANYPRMNKNIAQYSSQYDSINIRDLARRHDFPPLNLLRGIFLHRGMSPQEVYHIFTKNNTTRLSTRDREQFQMAQAHDAENSINQHKIADDAQYNEDIFVRKIADCDIDLYTQSELVESDIAKYGEAKLTPDILFKNPVKIIVDGVNHTIQWIDFKNYVGTDLEPMYSHNCAQAKKYFDEWGLGALCFRLSYVEKLSILGCILLDGNWLECEWV